MSGYRTKNVVKDNIAQAVAASQTNAAVSDYIGVTAEDSKNLLVRVVASAATVAAAITAKLQSSWDGGTTWKDHGTVSVTAAGSFEIEHDHSESTTGCLWPLARVVLTTGVGDSATVSAVHVSRRL